MMLKNNYKWNEDMIAHLNDILILLWPDESRLLQYYKLLIHNDGIIPEEYEKLRDDLKSVLLGSISRYFEPMKKD